MKKIIFLTFLFTGLFAFGQAASSAASSIAAASSSSASAVSAAAPLPVGDFLAQVLDFIKSFGGLSSVLKISGVVLLIIASMKVSILNSLVWSKLGSFQAWVAPILGLAAGILGLVTPSSPLSLAAVMTYLASGGGAILLHELLDTVKAIPGLGSIYVSIINTVESLLGGPAAKAAA